MSMSKYASESTALTKVSVIIPTTCQKERSKLLQRANESIVTQTGVVVDAIVVVNGNRYDPDLLTTLTADTRIRVIQIAEGNVSIARHVGVLSANGRFFCFLDDDDEYLSNALISRVGIFTENKAADVVVTNGFEHVDGEDSPLVAREDEDYIRKNPELGFFRRNWFASPASLFDAEAIGADCFDFIYKHFEWTYLFFFLLSKRKKIHFDPTITYRVNGGSPLSVSNTEEYAMAYPDFVRELIFLPLHPEIKRKLRAKYVTALNARSNIELKRGQRLLAWKSHMKCLMNGGWQYLPYTRHLLLP